MYQVSQVVAKKLRLFYYKGSMASVRLILAAWQSLAWSWLRAAWAIGWPQTVEEGAQTPGVQQRLRGAELRSSEDQKLAKVCCTLMTSIYSGQVKAVPGCHREQADHW